MSRNQLLRQLAERSAELYPTETAFRLEQLPVSGIAGLLQRLDAPLAARVVQRLRADLAADAIAELAEPAASAILGAIEPAQAAALLARLDEAPRASRLAALDRRLATELSAMMTYPPGVAGAIMDPRATTFRGETTAREALTRLRALKNRAIHTVFIVDEEGRLAGTVGLQDLALADAGTRLADLARRQPARVQALTPQDELVALAEEQRLSTLPVVDINERLVGVIRYADLLAASQSDATAGLQTMVGVSPEERALSTAFFAVRKRLPWLQVNLGTAFLAAAVVGLFEDTIARFTALAVLLPVVAGQSGNTGAQALAVTMRGLALREIRVRHWFRVARKELVVGAVNGLAVALVTALGVLAWSRSPGLAGVIGGAMVLSMIIAGVAGASVPMVLTLLRQDPAAASSIVLTTITDVMGFMTFLGFATLASGLL
jgi:magnesium transporter